MLKKLALAVTIAAAAAFAPASAAPLALQSSVAATSEGGLVTPVHGGHRHCRRVCHGELYWSPRHGHWHCHGHWHVRCHHHHW